MHSSDFFYAKLYFFQEGKNIYLFVTVNNGALTSKTQVWAKIEGPGNGTKKTNGQPTNFLSSQFRPPPPMNGGYAVNLPTQNKPPPPIPSRTTPPRPTAITPSTTKVPMTQKTSVATQTSVSTQTTISDETTSTLDTTSTPSISSTNPQPKDTRNNATETVLTPPTVTTQEPVQNNFILALVPIVIATIFLTAAGVVACMFRKRLFTTKVKTKKANSIVSKILVCNQSSFFPSYLSS